MLAEILCSLCLCSVADHRIVACHDCKIDTDRPTLSQVAGTLSKPSELLVSECYPKGTTPGLDWKVKSGLNWNMK